MYHALPDRQYTRIILVFLALLAGTCPAYGTDTYDPATKELQVPALAIGNLIFSNVALTVSSAVAQPGGISPNGSEDVYNPSADTLFAPAVQVGGTVYHNMMVSVARLDAIGNASGGDTFDGTHLNVPYIQAGTTIFTNVVLDVSPGNIAAIYGGLPSSSLDQYDIGAGQLKLGAVQFGSSVYTNVVLSVGPGSIIAVGGSSSGAAPVAPASLAVNASAATIPIDGSRTVTITALALSASNNVVPGVPVTFAATTGGAIAVTQGTTNASGTATATLSAANAVASSMITVTATAGNLNAQVAILVVLPSGSSGIAADSAAPGTLSDHSRRP